MKKRTLLKLCKLLLAVTILLMKQSYGQVLDITIKEFATPINGVCHIDLNDTANIVDTSVYKEIYLVSSTGDFFLKVEDDCNFGSGSVTYLSMYCPGLSVYMDLFVIAKPNYNLPLYNRLNCAILSHRNPNIPPSYYVSNSPFNWPYQHHYLYEYFNLNYSYIGALHNDYGFLDCIHFCPPVPLGGFPNGAGYSDTLKYRFVMTRDTTWGVDTFRVSEIVLGITGSLSLNEAFLTMDQEQNKVRLTIESDEVGSFWIERHNIEMGTSQTVYEGMVDQKTIVDDVLERSGKYLYKLSTMINNQKKTVDQVLVDYVSDENNRLVSSLVDNYLHIADGEGQSIMSVYSIFGSLLFQSTLQDGDNKFDLSNLASGYYIVQIADKHYKFMKQ